MRPPHHALGLLLISFIARAQFSTKEGTLSFLQDYYQDVDVQSTSKPGKLVATGAKHEATYEELARQAELVTGMRCRQATDIRTDADGFVHPALRRDQPCARLPDAAEIDMEVDIFWLVGPGRWTHDVVSEQITDLRNSGLLERVSHIHVWGQDYDRHQNHDDHPESVFSRAMRPPHHPESAFSRAMRPPHHPESVFSRRKRKKTTSSNTGGWRRSRESIGNAIKRHLPQKHLFSKHPRRLSKMSEDAQRVHRSTRASGSTGRWREGRWRDLFKGSPDVEAKIRPVNLGHAGLLWWTKQAHTFEFPALEGAWRHCSENKTNRAVLYLHTKVQSINSILYTILMVLYLHTKGSTKKSWHSRDYDWRQLMSHFVIRRYSSCLANLQCGYSTCGSALQKAAYVSSPWMHYSGNFWWARCDYLSALPSPRPALLELTRSGGDELASGNPPRGRYLAEWWVLGSGDGRSDAGRLFKNCWGTPGLFTGTAGKDGEPTKKMLHWADAGSDSWVCGGVMNGDWLHRFLRAGLPQQCNIEPAEEFSCALGQEGRRLKVGCPSSQIARVLFVDYGSPSGDCKRGLGYTSSVLNDTKLVDFVDRHCIGHEFCSLLCGSVTSGVPYTPFEFLNHTRRGERACAVQAWDQVERGSSPTDEVRILRFDKQWHRSRHFDHPPKRLAMKIACA
jgi:hypothetical protein